MGVDAAAVTSAEAAQYRAAGWWTDITLSECVARNATSAPDKPAYVEFSLDSPDSVLTWSEFDHGATNLAHRLLELGVGPGAGVAVWHKDTPAIHVLLVAIERSGAVAIGLGARAARARSRRSCGPRGRLSSSAMPTGSQRLSRQPPTLTQSFASSPSGKTSKSIPLPDPTAWAAFRPSAPTMSS
jgi:non-ribosomal peptide synthetase component F